MERSSSEGTHEVTATVTRINAFSTTHKSNPTASNPHLPMSNPKATPNPKELGQSHGNFGGVADKCGKQPSSSNPRCTLQPQLCPSAPETRSSSWPRPAIVSCGGMASPHGAPASRVFFFSFPRQENAGAVDALPCPGVRARRRPSGARARALPSPLLPSLQRDRERRD